MTTWAAPSTSTLAAARDEYFRINGFGPDGGYADAWVDFHLGPIPMPFPNTRGRRRVVPFHDLHHTLTGYGTDVLGEFEISAWEIGSGCGPHLAAWQLNLGALAGGVLSGVATGRTFRAFVHGRHSRNLYRDRYDEALLARRVGEVRRALGLDGESPRATPVDVAWFVAATAAGLVVGGVFLAMMVPVAIAANAARAAARLRPAGY